MPLQQINLDQSIYSKAIQNRMTPQGSAPQGGGTKQLPLSGSFNAPNSSLERMEAEWAESDKAKKQEREQQLKQLQNIGMQTVQQQQQQKQQVQQQQAQTKQQIESNPEPAAKEMYELMKTLPDEAKQQLLTQLFAPIPDTGGSMSSGGKTVQMPSKYNPIAGIFLEKGWAMFDPKGNVSLSEPEAVPEGEWAASGNVLYNKKTAEVKPVEGAGEVRPTSLNEMNEYKDKALGADSFEEAQGIVNEYNKYSEAIPIKIEQKEWANAQKTYLDKIKSSIDTLIDDKGWLQKGNKTADEVGLDFKGEQQVSVIYKKLYDEYIKYTDMLNGLKVDTSSYPKLKPLEKIKKVGGWEGALGIGVKGIGIGIQGGQYKSIYEE